MKLFKRLLIGLFSLLCVSCGGSTPDYWDDNENGNGNNGNGNGNGETEGNAAKPRYIWVDASANFPDFANNKDNIARDLALAKDAGFTDIVVDVRPTTGDVLFQTSKVDQVKYLYAWVSGVYSKVERTVSWDYLQAFVDEARKQGLKIHAAINTFVGGNTINSGTGLLYRDASKASWATQMNTSSGIVSIMQTGESAKFFNPANEEVQTFLCDLLKDLAKYDIDGIFLDRGRFQGFQSDFSSYTRTKFQEYLGNVAIPNFPADILAPGATSLPSSYPTYLTKWMEFRAKVIYDFMAKARNAVKSVNPAIKFGAYVGGWYSTYYDCGVNWASQKYNTSQYYKWATVNYKNYGYAALMDQMLIGAYASPLNVAGTSEWTMAGFCSLAMDKTKGDCPIVAGGPDVGNWDSSNQATQAQENQAIVNSVKACMDACDGYFLLDMIHLKLANQWQYAKEGIQLAIGK
jgi:uncharacterized lipoprotein YddW (UPF0748 family)